MKCIYCGNIIKEKTKEHIIQSALGSKLYSEALLCQDCNNFFARNESGKIDDVIAEQFKLIRNLFCIWGDRNSPPPVLRNLKLKSGKTINLAPGGIPIFSKSIREQNKTENGAFELTVISPNLEKAREQFYHVKRQFKNGFKLKIDSVKLKKFYIDEPLCIQTNFGGEIGLKAVIKIIYNFLFYLIRDIKIDLALDIDDFIELRHYIRYNKKVINVFASIDFKNPLPVNISSKSLSHYVIVAGSKEMKIIYGFFVAFGHIHFSCVLNNSYIGNDFIFGLEYNPINKQSKLLTDMQQKKFDPLVTKNYPTYAKSYFPRMQQKMASLLELYFTLTEKEILSDMIEGTMKCTFPDEGDIITHNHIESFSKKLSVEFIKFIYKMPTEKEMDIKLLYKNNT